MSQMVLKEANPVCIHNGLERSQFLMLISLCTFQMVLKEVKCVCIDNGPERSQFQMICHIGHYDGLERSHFLVLIFSWALTLACLCIL